MEAGGLPSPPSFCLLVLKAQPRSDPRYVPKKPPDPEDEASAIKRPDMAAIVSTLQPNFYGICAVRKNGVNRKINRDFMESKYYLKMVSPEISVIEIIYQSEK